MGSFKDSILSGKAYILMIFLQFGFAGMYTISVFSLKRGMNHYVLVVYRNLSATIFITPFAYFFERYVLVYRSIDRSSYKLAGINSIFDISGKSDPR